jgi:hypothetical protein
VTFGVTEVDAKGVFNVISENQLRTPLAQVAVNAEVWPWQIANGEAVAPDGAKGVAVTTTETVVEGPLQVAFSQTT